MIAQLNPSLPLTVEGRDGGLASTMIDYGAEHNLLWVTALDANGEIWCAPDPKARVQKNWSMGRTAIDWSRDKDASADAAGPADSTDDLKHGA